MQLKKIENLFADLMKFNQARNYVVSRNTFLYGLTINAINASTSVISETQFIVNHQH